MLVEATLPVPASLMTLLAGLAPLFTAPSFRTFCGLACGFLAQPGKWTVCGMLAGAGLARYGKTSSIQAAAVTCLWHSVFGTRPVTVLLIRDRTKTGYDLALVTADTAASPAQVIERYAARWSVEVAIEDSKQIFGAGQARNRTARAVERAIPFQLACQAITVTWYATGGHHPADVEDHRARAPWYRAKARPSTADMAAKLRRVLIAARFQASRPDQPTPEEINVIRLAWEALAA